MTIDELNKKLSKINKSYNAVLTNQKVRHNIEVFYVHDLKRQQIIASITPNGDLDLNSKYKSNDNELMHYIITYFTSNARVEGTYTY